MHLMKDHSYGGARRGTCERSRAKKPLVRPDPLTLFWHVPEASGAWLLGFLLSLGCLG
ncbi:Pol polyprotein [Gossypium arboreum]|uniref:Pol polyprotein n=1 Tax=Gossypium arboreum TaxID=29729 RepID=A0A0B0PA07_GOSAR|nr:Pol polyprotein [Gossypium arboreum]KHG23553.1 Pol polyprotein [Gossypium arboreum]